MRWNLIADSLNYVAAGSDQEVWGINTSGNPVRLDQSILIVPDPSNPNQLSDAQWVEQTPLPDGAQASMLDVGTDGTVVCLDTNNYIYRYNHLDASWNQIMNGGSLVPSTAGYIAVADASHIYQVGLDSRVYYYAGEGYWIQINSSQSTPAAKAISIGKNDTLLLIGLDDQIYRWDDRFGNFTTLTQEACKSLSCSSNSDIMVVTNDNKIKGYAGEGVWNTLAEEIIDFYYDALSDSWKESALDAVIHQMSHDSDGTCYILVELTDGMYLTYRMEPDPAMIVPASLNGAATAVETIS